MRMLRTMMVPAIVLGLALPFAVTVGHAETNKIKVGKTTSGSGFHIPSYIAMDQGFYKAEGLDATWVTLSGKALVTAALAGSVDFVPIPSGGSQAAMSGAKIRYVVGQSLKSQWVIVVPKEITKPEQLKGTTVGFGRQGSADYDEGAAVLLRFFNLQAGKDYKVISFRGEADRLAALVNGDVKAALVTVPHAIKGVNAGMKILLRTGDYIPRAGGAIWTRQEFFDKNPEAVKKFIRAIAKAVMYLRDNKEGSVKVIQKYLGIKSEKDAGLLWDQVHNTFGAEVPKDLFRHIFESRRKTMIAAKQWTADKPLPDPEQWLARDVLEATLKEMNYVPTKLEAPTKATN